MADATPSNTPPGTSSRIVGYPFIALEVAIARAKQLWSFEQKNLTPDTVAVSHWGYAPSSSGGKQTISALKQYGLISSVGGKDTREVRLTERAIDILIEPEDSAVRAQALREAALSPRLYGELLAKWPATALPSDHTIGAYLIREKHFNQKAVPDFIKNFKATIAFAELDAAPPKAVSADEGKESDVSVQAPQRDLPDQAISAASSVEVAPEPVSADVRQDTFTLDAGTVVLRWPARMSMADYEDFESWINIQLRKIKRSAVG